MSNLSNQLEEIKALIRSESNSDKSFAYSTLLHLQEQSCNDQPSIETLADGAQALISLIAVDVADNDEEIAAQALKCLGFMIYHQSIVALISADDINLILQSLAKLTTSTKMKTICNLGIWCISIQQINTSFLSAHFHSLLRAVVHALDNPIGSLSTTFEAMQAVMKLASQVSENMRESSHVWAPPIYRRLLSADKREHDMSERCLLTIRFMLFPPPSSLSKALAEDMKGKLLAGMKELLDQGKKLQTMQAWGWFIRLLGQHALKNRHLINDMLKIPEQTFLDKNPQVQVASQVAWEGLIDAIIHPPAFTCVTDGDTDNSAREGKTSMENSSKVPTSRLCSSIKLIMTPLIGIMSSKCDACVYSSSLSTWCYLLDKLGAWINHPSIVKLTLDPILQVVFHIGPNSKNLWAWNLCLDLLEDYILAKCQHVDSKSNSQESYNLSAGAGMLRTSAKCSLKHYPVKWFPWALSQLDFFLEMINIITSHTSAGTASLDNVNSASDAALRIFRSVLKGVQVQLKSSSSDYNEIMMCLNTLLHFVKKTCEDVHSDGRGRNDLHLTSLQFIEVVTEELEPSILGSTLYKVPLDPKHIENVQLAYDSRCAIPPGINSIAYMGMVSPSVYLVVLYICKANELILNVHGGEFALQRVRAFFKGILFLYDPLESLSAAVGLLYKYLGFDYLWLWIPIAEALKDCLVGVENLSLLKVQYDSPGYLTMCHLLLYPFVVCCCRKLRIIPVDISGLSIESLELSEKKLEFGRIVKVWTSVYVSCSSPNLESFIQCFPEELFSMLNQCVEKNTSMLECDTECDLSCKNLDLGFINLFGSIVVCGLEQFSTLETSSAGNRSKHDGNDGISEGINCRLGFAARFLELSWTKREKYQPPDPFEMSRVFSALTQVVCCLQLKQRIISFVEMITCPLLKWLSLIQHDSVSNQLQLLWAEILVSLRRSQPPIVFDSASLKLHATLLEPTLDHPNSSISEPTIAFWNSTYGEQINLHFPQNLVNVLDKLSRNKRITLQKRNLPFLVKCQARATATNNSRSKRVELVEDTLNQSEQTDKVCSSLKRKRIELTEHQREVRRAQQGKERDCSGHGTGIRTYTSVDFSQGNGDSQESQEI